MPWMDIRLCSVYFMIHRAQEDRGKFDSNYYNITLLPGVGVHTDFNPGLTSEQAAATQW